MAKIHPKSVEEITDRETNSEIYTMWMKSLVFHGNGCTVFNCRGEVVFRVDNYQQRCRRRVFLMDSDGRVLFSLTRKKLRIFESWEGFKWMETKGKREKLAWFQVRRNHSFLSKNMSCQVTFKNDETSDENRYEIIGFEGKSMLKIIDISNLQILAQAEQKQTVAGVPLGEDVLRLMVEPRADQRLIMALITAYGLINKKL